MKLVIRTLALWFLLAGLVWLFFSKGQSRITLPPAFGSTPVRAGFNSWFTLGLVASVIPACAMWLTITAVPLLPQRWPVRFVFWMGTVIAWFAAAVMLQARTESDPGDRWAALFGVAVTGLTAVWLFFKVRPFQVGRVLGEIVIAAALWGVIGVAVFRSYEETTRLLRERAEARWAEIGLPMAEFEKTLVVTPENAGTEILRQVLRERLGGPIYKVGTRAAQREPTLKQPLNAKKLAQDVAEIASAAMVPSDDVDLSTMPVASIESLGAALEADYRRILAVESPTWACDPHDGPLIDVPNFLGLRQFALLIAADATRRLTEGDEEGAARAISAGLHMTARLRQNPTLVSLMIRVAIEALLAPKRARLPASEEDLQAVARDAAELRAEFLKRIQLESWRYLRFTDQMGEYQQVEIGVLPQWLGRIWRRRQVMKAALNGAEHAAIEKDPATLALPDLGISRHDAVSEASPTVMEFNVSRAAMRITAVLLLREQGELIRLARVRWMAGMPMEPYQSAVIPTARWEITIDSKNGTVSTRLVGAPLWILQHEVTSPQFWCLPLDGSRPWQFHQPKKTTDSQ